MRTSGHSFFNQLTNSITDFIPLTHHLVQAIQTSCRQAKIPSWRSGLGSDASLGKEFVAVKASKNGIDGTLSELKIGVFFQLLDDLVSVRFPVPQYCQYAQFDQTSP
jgi:hypothetical protein